MSHDPSIQSLFHEARMITTEAARETYLDRACGDDAALRARVEALLRADAAGSEFLPGLIGRDREADPKIAAAAGAAQDQPHDGPQGKGSNEHPGGVIGRYKLQREIGEGGFGSVWMAEQQEPVRRKVALKVIKLGMDTKQVIARFEVERQALALMDHPNIAKVLDGGVTPGGRPYFVMELVKGVPITTYCDQEGLGMADRLELFQQVCYAVQHAHQKGVIHRDLKPSNILVTLNNGIATPKVIDFGIAKATSSELTQQTLFTEHGQVIGTPEYMAPEQAELTGLDIDTRADVYSLGVLLYELLTGTKPFEATALREQGYHEMLRVIREEEPPKPSTRISTLGEAMSTVTARHRLTPKALGRLIRGDLDWIVMKALSKDRGRRYATANDFAADVGRHLQDEPVQAGPPSKRYRLRKYVRRHRIGVFAGSAVCLALVGGLGAATWGYFEADTQRVRAEKAETDAVTDRDAARKAQAKAEKNERRANIAASRARAVTELVKEMLGSADPDQIKGKNYTVRQLLDDFDEELGDRLKGYPAVELSLRQIMGYSYLGLGSFARAESCFERALALSRRRFGDEHAEVVQCLGSLAQTLGRRGKFRESEAMYRDAIAMAKRIHGEDDIIVAGYLGDLAVALDSLAKWPEAEKLHRQSLAMKREILGDDSERVALSMDNLANLLSHHGQLAKAVSMSREAFAIRKKVFDERHPQAQLSLNNLACLLNKTGEHEEAERMHRKLLAMRRELFGDSHRHVATTLSNLAWGLKMQGRVDEAEEMFREAMAIWRKHPDSPHLVSGLEGLTALLKAQGKRAEPEAEALVRELYELNAKMVGEDNWLTARSLGDLGNTLYKFGKHAEAEKAHRDALTILHKLFGEENRNVATTLNNLACALIEQGKYEEGTAMHERVLAMRKKLLGDDHPEVAATIGKLAHCYYSQQKFKEAERFIREELALHRKRHGDDHPNVAVSRRCLANALSEQGMAAEAEPMYHEVLATLKRHGCDKGERAVDALQGQAMNLTKQGKRAEAGAVYAKLADLQRERVGDDDPQVAAALEQWAWALHDDGQHAEAIAKQQEVVARYRAFYGNEHGEVARSLGLIADYLNVAGNHEESMAHAREALALARKVHGDEHVEVAVNLDRVADQLAARGKHADALPLYREALPILRQADRDRLRLAATLFRYGFALSNLGKFVEAEPLQREALEVYRELDNPTQVTNTLGNLAYSLYAQQKFEEATKLQAEGLELQRKLHGNEHKAVVHALNQLGAYMSLGGDNAGAEKPYREALATSRKLHADNHPEVASALGALAGNLLRQGKPALAKPLFRQALVVLEEHYGEDSEQVGVRRFGLATILINEGKHAEAEVLLRQAAATLRKVHGEAHQRVRKCIFSLADVLAHQNKHDDLIAVLRDGLAVTRKLFPAEHPELAGVLARLGTRLLRDQPAAAEPLLRESLAIRSRVMADSWLRYNSASVLGAALSGQSKFAQAEPLLLEGFEKMQPPEANAIRKTQALQRIVKLYEAWDKPEEATKWRARLPETNGAKKE